MHMTSFLISVLSHQQNTVFESKDGSSNASAQFKTKPVMLGHFLAKHVIEIALPWQQLRSQVVKTVSDSVLCAALKVTKFQPHTRHSF